MPDRFHVGQRVRLHCVGSDKHGLLGTVITGRRLSLAHCATHHKKEGELQFAYTVDVDALPCPFVPGNLQGWAVEEENLRPVGDDKASFERFLVRLVEPRKVLSVRSREDSTAKF